MIKFDNKVWKSRPYAGLFSRTSSKLLATWRSSAIVTIAILDWQPIYQSNVASSQNQGKTLKEILPIAAKVSLTLYSDKTTGKNPTVKAVSHIITKRKYSALCLNRNGRHWSTNDTILEQWLNLGQNVWRHYETQGLTHGRQRDFQTHPVKWTKTQIIRREVKRSFFLLSLNTNRKGVKAPLNVTSNS